MMSADESASIFISRLVSSRRRDAQRRAAPRMLSVYTALVVAKLRNLAPYAAIELVLPGGSLIALLLWFYRRQKKASLGATPILGADGGALPAYGSPLLR
jgi:hypothetical protein